MLEWFPRNSKLERTISGIKIAIIWDKIRDSSSPVGIIIIERVAIAASPLVSTRVQPREFPMLEMKLVFRTYVPKYHNSKNSGDRLEQRGPPREEGSINRRLIRARGAAVARLNTCQTGWHRSTASKAIFVAICDPVSRRKWIPAVNFAAERRGGRNVSRRNSASETNLLILFAPPGKNNLIKILYSPWNDDKRGQGETRGGGRRGWIIFHSGTRNILEDIFASVDPLHFLFSMLSLSFSTFLPCKITRKYFANWELLSFEVPSFLHTRKKKRKERREGNNVTDASRSLKISLN